jgi:hypothetical protein
MLSLFPSLLQYTYFMPTLFRLTVAAVFVYLVIYHFKHKKVFASELKMVSHEVASWFVGIAILVEMVVAAGFFLGFGTQLVAILGILGFAKMALFKNKFPTYAPLSRLSYVLLIVICFSILVTGAGVFAFDLPL